MRGGTDESRKAFALIGSTGRTAGAGVSVIPRTKRASDLAKALAQTPGLPYLRTQLLKPPVEPGGANHGKKAVGI